MTRLLAIAGLVLTLTSGSASEVLPLVDDAKFAAVLAQVEADRPGQHDKIDDLWVWVWNLSSAAFDARAYERAEWASREIAVMSPQDPIVWSNLSVALGKQGKHVEAEVAARRALAIDPDYLHARLVLPSWLLGQGQREQALAEFTAVPRPAEGSDLVLYWTAQACFFADAGDVAKIEEGIREALRLDSEPATFFRRDLVFDPYRTKPWFVDLVGETLAQPY